MSNLRNAISDFLDGFGAGMLFSPMPRRGAATQVFADDEVPCHPKVQELFEATSDLEKRSAVRIEQGRHYKVSALARFMPVDQDEEWRLQQLKSLLESEQRFYRKYPLNFSWYPGWEAQDESEILSYNLSPLKLPSDLRIPDKSIPDVTEAKEKAGATPSRKTTSHGS